MFHNLFTTLYALIFLLHYIFPNLLILHYIALPIRQIECATQYKNVNDSLIDKNIQDKPQTSEKCSSNTIHGLAIVFPLFYVLIRLFRLLSITLFYENFNC